MQSHPDIIQCVKQINNTRRNLSTILPTKSAHLQLSLLLGESKLMDIPQMSSSLSKLEKLLQLDLCLARQIFQRFLQK